MILYGITTITSLSYLLVSNLLGCITHHLMDICLHCLFLFIFWCFDPLELSFGIGHCHQHHPRVDGTGRWHMQPPAFGWHLKRFTKSSNHLEVVSWICLNNMLRKRKKKNIQMVLSYCFIMGTIRKKSTEKKTNPRCSYHGRLNGYRT